jgi:hypothetical protein
MNHGVEDLGATMLPQACSDVGGERGPRIEFRQQDVRCRERQIHRLPHPGEGVQQLAHPFDREGPHVDGNEEVGAGHERRLHQEA